MWISLSIHICLCSLVQVQLEWINVAERWLLKVVMKAKKKRLVAVTRIARKTGRKLKYLALWIVKDWIIFFVCSRCPESLRPETVRPCLLPCRKDCIVTPYSDWTPCPSSCREGMGNRFWRFFTQDPYSAGRLTSSRWAMFMSLTQPCPSFSWMSKHLGFFLEIIPH